MPAHSPQSTSTPRSDSQRRAVPKQKSRNWGALVLLSVIALGIAVVAALILAAVVPVQWAQFVGQQVHGRVAVSTWYGLLAGLLLTWISLSVLWQARRKMRWGWRMVLVTLAALIALPNLLTAAVAYGSSDSVHAAQRILQADATFFSTSTGYGAAAGAVLFLIGALTGMAFRRRGRKLKELKAERQSLMADSGSGSRYSEPRPGVSGQPSSRAAERSVRTKDSAPRLSPADGSAQPSRGTSAEGEEEFSWMKEK